MREMKKTLPIICTSLLLVLLFLGGAEVAEALEFNRDEVENGAIWRLFSCNLVHFDASHLIWDIGALVVLSLALMYCAPGMMKISLAAALTVIAVAVYNSDYTIYRGISGVDSALFGTLTAVLLVRSLKGRDWVAFGAVLAGALGFFGKILAEVLTGAPVFAEQAGYAPAPEIHLVAFIAGISASGIVLTVEYIRTVGHVDMQRLKEVV